MTLATNIWFQTDAPLSEVYVWVEHLIKGRVAPVQGDWDYLKSKPGYQEQFCNVMGQGCDSMYLSYRFHGTLADPDDLEEGFFVENPTVLRTPDNWVCVKLDTSYAGRSVSGYNCSQLHWEIIKAFFDKLGEDNVFWTNEFRGTISQGRRGPCLGG
jgi:hypothetical protein